MMTSIMTPVAATEDAELVSASLAGNREAFEWVVARYQSLVCSLAYSATGSLSQSEDLAQETFLAAWKHLAELREPAKLRPWLCGIARLLINNALRRQGREPSHRAASLEEIPESPSPEPLPVERAISREEAEILWRSLERIPETYRLPLVLFYREHQSVEAVAQSLELTEETVRQRLSRGRKLLQEEVLAFVEGALAKSAPGRTFTVAVVAALPIAVTSAKAASISVAAAKGGAAAKSVFSWGALGGLLTMLGAIIFSWKMAVDETKSPRERKFIVRLAWFQVAFAAVSLTAGCYWLPQLGRWPTAFGLALAGLLLANVVNAVVLLKFCFRRRLEISMEEGTFMDTVWNGPGEESDRKASRKAFKFTIPFLIMLAGGTIGLPWKEHWARCAAVVAAEGLVIFWAYRWYRRMLTFQVQLPVQTTGLRALLRHPLIRLPAIFLGTALLAGGVGFMLPSFLNPRLTSPAISTGSWLTTVGWCLLVVALVYGLFALLFMAGRKFLPGWSAVFDQLAPLLTQSLRPEAIIDQTHGPFFQQLNLTPDQIARMKDLILKGTMAEVTQSMSLMHRRLDPARRAALIEELKRQKEDNRAQIRRLLGEENYLAFQAYEKTVPNRTMINQFNRKWRGSSNALSPAQQEQLLQALNTARAQYHWTTDLSRRNQDTHDLGIMLSEDNLKVCAREEEEFDRQFLIQAERILGPKQLAAFQQFQTRQRQSQLAGMKLATRLFAPKGR